MCAALSLLPAPHYFIIAPDVMWRCAAKLTSMRRRATVNNIFAGARSQEFCLHTLIFARTEQAFAHENR